MYYFIEHSQSDHRTKCVPDVHRDGVHSDMHNEMVCADLPCARNGDRDVHVEIAVCIEGVHVMQQTARRTDIVIIICKDKKITIQT